MEYVSAGSEDDLRDLPARAAADAVAMAAFIASKVCEGWTTPIGRRTGADGLNIVHRDVSPQNVSSPTRGR